MRKQKWLALIAVPPFLVAVFVAGLFMYITATAKPLHPDPKNVASVTEWSPSEKWSAPVEAARQIARANLIEQNLPGLSVAVGSGGAIVWAEGFGWADPGQPLPGSPA